MFPDVSPTARGLHALEVLQARPGITATDLATRLGVSDRAARRCVATLREAGIPIESVRGPYGGYRLGRGLRLPPLMFTATEALGLVMGVLDGDHAAADPDQPVGSALGKLIAALPENVGRQAALMRAHAAAAPNRMAVRPDPATTTALVEAVAGQRRVSIAYHTEASRTWTERVDPWAVVVRYGKWYLLCHSHRAGAVRTYRIDRVSDVRETGEGFDLPADLDGVATLERHLGMGWEYPTRVVFDAPADQVAPWIGPAMGSLGPHPDDPARCVLVGSTSTPEAYAGEWLAAVPFDFHVEGGPELAGAVRSLAARFAAATGEA